MICAFVNADLLLRAALTDDSGNTFVISLSADVTAGLVDSHVYESVVGPYTVLSSDEGNDWPNGIVVLHLTAGQLQDIEPGIYSFEVKVVQSGRTYRTRINNIVNLKQAVI